MSDVRDAAMDEGGFSDAFDFGPRDVGRSLDSSATASSTRRASVLFDEVALLVETCSAIPSRSVFAFFFGGLLGTVLLGPTFRLVTAFFAAFAVTGRNSSSSSAFLLLRVFLPWLVLGLIRVVTLDPLVCAGATESASETGSEVARRLVEVLLRSAVGRSKISDRLCTCCDALCFAAFETLGSLPLPYVSRSDNVRSGAGLSVGEVVLFAASAGLLGCVE